MIDPSLLAVFIPTFFCVSFLPGMCMTLALTMGMSVGLRRSLYMMGGELFGLALVAGSTLLGVSSLMLNFPLLFTVLKFAGAGYLFFLGLKTWSNKGQLSLEQRLNAKGNFSNRTLINQGLVTALANPKAWAFMVSLLPPFISPAKPVVPQSVLLILIILVIEFICLLIYASGGSTLRAFLQRKGNLLLMNRITGGLLIGLGLWLVRG